MKRLLGITVLAVALGAAATPASAASITRRGPADVEIAQLAAPNVMVADSAALTTSTKAADQTAAAPNGDGMMSFNFRGASLDSVLDYMSKAGGFVIVRSVNVDGRVDVVSHQPLNRAEAVELLNTVLNEKGYAAVRNGRVLKIVSRDDARTNNIPVKKGSDPEKIPSTDDMITQIIPVRYADATAMLTDIQQLLPSWATATANISSNSIVLTDTQANVQRIAQIVKALDTSISEITTIQVYLLKFADAQQVTDMINNLFTTSNSTGNRNNMRGGMAAMFQARFGGGGFGGPGGQGGMGGMGGMGQQQQDSQARQAASRILAVADTRTNAVVVSAPEELHATIKDIIGEVDKTEELQTQIQVFPLQFADATEMTDIITNMYKDATQTAGATANRGRNMFGGGAFPGGFQGNQQRSGAAGSTQRQLQQKTVTAVADTRTNSVIVIAVDSVLQQVGQVIANLDKDPAGHQKVFVYQLHNADGEQVATMLQDMFQNGGTSRRSTSSYSSTNRNSNNYNNSNNRNSNSNRNSSNNSSNRNSNYGSSYGNSSSYNRSSSSRY